MKTDKLKKGRTYPVAATERRYVFRLVGLDRVRERTIRAIWDGQPKRCPRAGEWFLSGATIEAYRATKGLTSAYYIAKLVEVEKYSMERIIGKI